jgi:uncharacterized protein YkwD
MRPRSSFEHPRWRGCAAALLLYALGCAGTRGAEPKVPAAPHAVRYDAAETAGAVRGDGDLATLERAVAQTASQAGLALRGDGRLAALAQQLATTVPDVDVLDAAARELGLVDAGLSMQRIRASSAELLAATLASELGPRLRELGPTHFGAFVLPGGSAVSIVLGRRPLALDPVARELPRGAMIRLRGRLASHWSNPRLKVAGPDAQLLLPAGAGPEFELLVPTRAVGAYRLELSALVDGRSQALAELVVYVGAAPEREQARTRVAAPPALATLRERLYARTAALRVAHGLPTLAVDAALELRADAHSQVLAADSLSARAPNEPSDSQGPASGPQALQTVARGSDEEALWSALVADGALRTRLLNPDATHLGIGVARASRTLIATHLLAQLGPALDPELGPARVLGALNENRRARGVVALRPAPELTDVAQRAASELAAHPERSSRDILARANAELERLRLAYGRVAAVAALVRDPLEAAALEPALDPSARAAGIAVAQSTATATGTARVAVVIALGWER